MRGFVCAYRACSCGCPALQAVLSLIHCAQTCIVQDNINLRYSLAGQDTRLSPERPGFESRWRKFGALCWALLRAGRHSAGWRTRKKSDHHYASRRTTRPAGTPLSRSASHWAGRRIAAGRSAHQWIGRRAADKSASHLAGRRAQPGWQLQTPRQPPATVHRQFARVV